MHRGNYVHHPVEQDRLVTMEEAQSSDPNHINKGASGGVFVHCDAVSEQLAEVNVQVDVAHDSEQKTAVSIELDTALKEIYEIRLRGVERQQRDLEGVE